MIRVSSNFNRLDEPTTCVAFESSSVVNIIYSVGAKLNEGSKAVEPLKSPAKFDYGRFKRVPPTLSNFLMNRSTCTVETDTEGLKLP